MHEVTKSLERATRRFLVKPERLDQDAVGVLPLDASASGAGAHGSEPTSLAPPKLMGDTRRAMSERNVELIRDVYEAGNRGDWAALFRIAHPDIEWETDPRLPNAGTYRGREEIQRFYEDQAAPFDRSVIELERLVANGDYVVALVRVRRRLRGSTAEIDLRLGHLWTIRDGKVVRGQAFAERERALEAAGLPRSHT